MDVSELPRVEGVPDESVRRPSPGATGTPPTTCWRWPPSAASWRSRSCPDLPDLLAEAVYAARREQARGVADVLLRRTRLGLLAAREVAGAGSEVPERVARALAGELGWDDSQTSHEVERFRGNALAEGLLPGTGS